jgi:hypothetical protein
MPEKEEEELPANEELLPVRLLENRCNFKFNLTPP